MAKNAHWQAGMFRQVSLLCEKYDLKMGAVQNDFPDMADIIITLDENNMIGLKFNPPLSVKPFKLFPYGHDVGLDEVEAMITNTELHA